MLSKGINIFILNRFRMLSLKPVMQIAMPALVALMLMSSCVSDTVNTGGVVAPYQEALVENSPQERTATDGLEQIRPVADPRFPVLEAEENTSGDRVVHLSIKDAVMRALVNSPEIAVFSFDPSIAREGIGIAAAEFDVTAFGQYGYDKQDYLANDISESGRSHSSLWEAGVKQKGITGAEWSLAYSYTRSVDESLSRRFNTGYEPTMTLELKQPLLRDAWTDINMAHVNISKLHYKKSLEDFRRKAEEISTRVIALYWSLYQSRHDVEIQEALLQRTAETLRKVEDRKDIDATLGDIKQAEASLKLREAAMLNIRQKLSDIQDRLVRVLADHQMNLIDDLEIIPTTSPGTGSFELDQSALMELALNNNPDIGGAQLDVKIAEISADVAKRQRMPRLDVVASAQTQGLSDSPGEAYEAISGSDYVSYTFGLNFEYPFGNRERKSEYRLKKHEHSKALSNLQNISDKVASQVKESHRSAMTAHSEIAIQKDAVSAAGIHLQSLEDIETVRKKLTPEFLLAKIQAQDSLARAQRSEIKAIADYNISLARIAEATGKVKDLQYMEQFVNHEESILTEPMNYAVVKKSSPAPEKKNSLSAVTEKNDLPFLHQRLLERELVVLSEEEPAAPVWHGVMQTEYLVRKEKSLFPPFRHSLLENKSPLQKKRIPLPYFHFSLMDSLLHMGNYQIAGR